MDKKTHETFNSRSDVRGQTIIEYLLMVVAAIVVLIFFLGQNGPFRGALESTLKLSFNQVEQVARNVDFGNGAIP